MRTGFSDSSESQLELQENVAALTVAFAENALTNAAEYTRHSGRAGVLPEDIKRALMLEALIFTRRPGVKEQAEAIKAELRLMDDQDDDCDVLPDASHEGFTLSACGCALCGCMNDVHARWAEWTPSSPFEEILQRHIGSISL